MEIKWKILSVDPIRGKYGQIYLNAKCECGITKKICKTEFTSGRTKSCRKCRYLDREIYKNRNTANGTRCGSYRHGLWGTVIYKTWQNMITRCTNKKWKRFKDYGGRGIKVCDQWRYFDNFYKDMGDKPKGMQLDRIDVNGNYELSNCRWVTAKENMNNRRH